MSSSTPGTSPLTALEAAFSSITPPSTWPMPLPIVHASIARWFGSIVADGELRPRPCPVFGEDLLYFFYGGVFYRPASGITRNATELPIAFLFEPSVLTTMRRFYPFDTGAMDSGRLGSVGSRLKSAMSTFAVLAREAHSAAQIVHHIFGSNQNYVKGIADAACETKPVPIPDLYELITQDLAKSGTDHRQCSIECQSNIPMELGQHLVWVAFPESQYSSFADLYRRKTYPRIPKSYAYQSHAIFRPQEIAYDIHKRALEFIEEYLKAI